MMENLDNLKFSRTTELDEKTVGLNTSLETILQNKEIVKWAQLLCEIGDAKEFTEILHTSKSELLAIMKYRKILHQRNKETTFIELNTAYTNNQFDKLHKLLEKMFLESIAEGQFEFILNKINSTENGIERLHCHHIKDKGLRALRVVLIL